MKRVSLLFLLSVLSVAHCYADVTLNQLQSKVQKTEDRLGLLEKTSQQTKANVFDLKKDAATLSKAHEKQQQRINDLQNQLEGLERQQNGLVRHLSDVDLQNKELNGSLAQLSRQTDQKTQRIDQMISLRTQWYATAILLMLLLLTGVYWYLGRRSRASEQSLSDQVQRVIETVRASEEKVAIADTALADSLFAILSQMKAQDMAVAASTQGRVAEPNHHLPLKLADEIHRMRKRLSTLPAETKGLTPLKKSLERLETELADQGYEIIDHTGMAYTENLSVTARFIPSDELDAEQSLISKVVTPQMNYYGVLIRMADIEVSIGS